MWTSTSAGRFCGVLEAPGYKAPFTVTLTVYGPSQVQVRKTTYAVAPRPASLDAP